MKRPEATKPFCSAHKILSKNMYVLLKFSHLYVKFNDFQLQYVMFDKKHMFDILEGHFSKYKPAGGRRDLQSVLVFRKHTFVKRIENQLFRNGSCTT